jgi:FAD-dependent urate hydroxylase
MRVMIMGAGVAGSVAALALRQAGHEPVVYEAYQQSAGLAHGVYLTVAVNGLDALRAVGMHRVVTERGFPSGRIEFFSGTGRQLGSLAMGPQLPDGTVTHTIRRSALYDGLYDEVTRRGIRIEHGRRLVGADRRPGGGVLARFADGGTAEGDLLVGADGVHSVTRALIDPANPAPRYTGLGNTGGFVPAGAVPDLDAGSGDYRMIWGRDCFFGYTVSPDGEIWWFANPPSRTEPSRAELRALGTDRLRERLLALLAPDRTPGAAIVRAATGFGLTNQYDLPTVPTWHDGALVVIGDAAHAVSPASGQGASLAAEDAVTLARCLRGVRDPRGVPAALEEYERLRRDRVERIVAWAAGMNNTKKQGLVGRALRDLFLPVILRRGARPGELAKVSWIFEHRVEPIQSSTSS